MQQTNPLWLISQAPQDLKAQIRIATQSGFHITSQTATTAQLLRAKKFSVGMALLWLLLFGVGLLIYFLYYLSKSDDSIYLDMETQPSKEELAATKVKPNWKNISTGKKVAYTIIGVLIGFWVISAISSDSDKTPTSANNAEAVQQTPETLKALIKSELEQVNMFDGEAMRKGQETAENEVELGMFNRWGVAVADGKKSDDKETVNLSKELEKKASGIQSKEFPLLRKIAGEAFRRVFWPKDIEVKVSGNKNEVIEFTGLTFAANQNILDFQTPIDKILRRLRFSKVRYRWSEGASGTGFDYTAEAEFVKDGDVVPIASK